MQCPQCLVDKPEEEFAVAVKTESKTYRRRKCRQCMRGRTEWGFASRLTDQEKASLLANHLAFTQITRGTGHEFHARVGLHMKLTQFYRYLREGRFHTWYAENLPQPA